MEKISFVIPCYRSELTLSTVVKEIQDKMLERQEFIYEIVLVNDCSPDNVWSVITNLAKKDSRIIGVNLSRNYGQGSAKMAGLRNASGDYVVSLDDDGQCPVDKTWDLLEPLLTGQYDMSVAKYPHKKQSLFKNFGSKVNHYTTHLLLDMPKGLEMTNFYAMNRMLYSNVLNYPNPYPFLTGLVCNITKQIINVPMEERERLQGKTGYTFKKLIAMWMNGFTNFSIIPLRVADVFGIICALLGFIIGFISIIRKLLNHNILIGYTSLLASMFLIGGVVMLLLGMIGEYIGRIFICINNTPQYTVREIVRKNE